VKSYPGSAVAEWLLLSRFRYITDNFLNGSSRLADWNIMQFLLPLSHCSSCYTSTLGRPKLFNHIIFRHIASSIHVYSYISAVSIRKSCLLCHSNISIALSVDTMSSFIISLHNEETGKNHLELLVSWLKLGRRTFRIRNSSFLEMYL
jgi:hypothetical protein